jgi:hypothetical protein
MSALTLTRSIAAVTDDDGSGTTGTVFNNAWYQLVCDAIDALFVVGGDHNFEAAVGAGGNALTVRNTMAGATNYSAMFLGTDSSATLAYLQAFSSTFTTAGTSHANGASLVCEGDGGLSMVATSVSGDIRIYVGGVTERARFTNALAADNGLFLENSLHVGALARVGRSTTNSTNAIHIYNGTAPAGTATGLVTLYCTSGELRVMDAAATRRCCPRTITTRTNGFTTRSIRGTGRRLRIDMERLMRAIDAQLGGGFVHEGDAA